MIKRGEINQIIQDLREDLRELVRKFKDKKGDSLSHSW